MTAAVARPEPAPKPRVLVAEDEFLVYLVLEDYGRHGRAWCEADVGKTDLGQGSCLQPPAKPLPQPVQVVDLLNLPDHSFGPC